MEQENTLKPKRGPDPSYTPEQAAQAYDLHVKQKKTAYETSKIMGVDYWMVPRMAAAHKRTLGAQ